jgi:endonuclease/exonuclease/phosphatase family metal-dependent hydrolase
MLYILTFNLEYGAEKYGYKQACKIIQSLRPNQLPDIIALQEVQTSDGIDMTPSLAQFLSYPYYLNLSTGAILSYWPITLIDFSKDLVLIKKNNQDYIYLILVHMTDSPYQPFQAQNIEYCQDIEKIYCQQPIHINNPHELYQSAFLARGKELNELISTINSLGKDVPIIILGDFNEPSHLDWTDKAYYYGLIPFASSFPISTILKREGCVDVYRHIYPNEITHPGYTWPTYPHHRPDRIDFIYVRNFSSILDCQIHHQYSSDHYPISALIRFHDLN